MAGQAGADPTAMVGSTAKSIALPEGAINFNMGTLVGSYASVARMLDSPFAARAAKRPRSDRAGQKEHRLLPPRSITPS
jgi:pyrimidine oxygenase